MRYNLNFPRTDFFLFFSIMERIRKGSDLPKKSGGHRTRFEDKAHHRP